MVYARLSNIVTVAILAALMLLPARPAESQLQSNRPWIVWMNTAQCSMTRQSWLAVAQDNPGMNSAPGWIETPGYSLTFDPADAFAQLDVLRISSPWFRSAYCCPVQVWNNASTGAFSIVKVGDPPAQGFTAPTVPMCCEDAVGIAGFDPFGCTSVALVSVPGAVVTIGPTGPVSQGGTPITIPTKPPVVVAAPIIDDGKKRPAGQSLGCFVDTNNPYNLDGYLSRSSANTPEQCVSTCRDKGFKYAGVEYGQSCLCGNSYDRYGPANNCDMACTGDSSKTCGGYNANEVYTTGL